MAHWEGMKFFLLIVLFLPHFAGAEKFQLFNGRNLEGFYTWLVDSGTNDPRNVFSVTNGMIRISGDGLGYLSTQKSYSNYVLELEFQWGRTNTHWGDRIGKARDSGIFIHSIGPDGNSVDGKGAFKAAIECQIMEGAIGDFLLIRGKGLKDEPLNPMITVKVSQQRDKDNWFYYDPSGTPKTVERWGRVNRLGKSEVWQDTFGFRDAVEKQVGEWNTLRLDTRGGSIKVFLNNCLVNEAAKVYPNSGPILLQCEGSEIFYRRIVLDR